MNPLVKEVRALGQRVLLNTSTDAQWELRTTALQLADLVETLEGEKAHWYRWRDAMTDDLNGASEKLGAIRFAVQGKLDLSDTVERVQSLLRERDEARRDLEDCRRGPRPNSTNSNSSFAAAFDALNADEE